MKPINTNIMKRLLVSVLLASLSTTVQATKVTGLYEITLPYASGPYSAGHVLKVTATYDDDGTVMHRWHDGANGIAEFGDGDDIIIQTYNLADNPSATLYSDADISISGLLLPTGATPAKTLFTNRSSYSEYFDPSTNGTSVLSYVAEDLLTFTISISRESYWGPNGHSSLIVTQAIEDASGSFQFLNLGVSIDSVDEFKRTRIPEPTTLILTGIGLSGIGYSRHRSKKTA